MGCVVCSRTESPESSNTLPRPENPTNISAPTEGQYMSCGHFITKSKMIQIISNQTDSGRSSYTCPITENNKVCSTKWNLKQCYKTAAFTLTQINQANNKLSLNAIKNNFEESPLSLQSINLQLQILQKPSRNLDIFKQIQKEKRKQTKKIKLLPLKIKLITNNEVIVEISESCSIKELKNIIYQKYYNQFEPEQTVLSFNQTILDLEKYIKSLKLTDKTVIIQRKAQLWQIPSIQADKSKIDPVLLEIGVAKMSCGHELGREFMIGLIKYQVSSRKCAIQCSEQKSQGQPCDQKWNKRQWMLVAGFSKSEMREIQNSLSQNWIHHHTKKCPFCSQLVTINGLNTRRVVCSKCKSPDFCFTCLNPWKGNNDKFCDSDVCKLLKSKIINAPKTRKFTLINKKSLKTQDVWTPQFRACPRCMNIVENYTGCKHTKCSCTNYKFSFCFVCLSLCKNEKFICGEYNENCGYLAPPQSFD